MKALLLIFTFLTFSTCVPVTYNRNCRATRPMVQVVTVNPQPYFYPYYGYSQTMPVRPPYIGNVYHKPKNAVIVRGGRRR